MFARRRKNYISENQLANILFSDNFKGQVHKLFHLCVLTTWAIYVHQQCVLFHHVACTQISLFCIIWHFWQLQDFFWQINRDLGAGNMEKALFTIVKLHVLMFTYFNSFRRNREKRVMSTVLGKIQYMLQIIRQKVGCIRNYAQPVKNPGFTWKDLPGIFRIYSFR